MKRGISSNTRHELIGALSERYRQGSRSEKGKILDELVKLTKFHRKHAIRIMNQGRPSKSISVRPSRRIYDEAVHEALVAIWEAADRICGKRLRIVMPDYVESLERHGHLKLNSDLRKKLLSVNAATIKLRHKTREGARVQNSYFPPATPCDRLLKNEKVSEEAKERLREQKAYLDPVRLLHTIRELQATLAALASSNGFENGVTPESKSLAEFLKQLPRLWKDGEVRPTHRKATSSPRNWRTRVDPFDSVWPELLDWLQRDPDTMAKDLQRLRTKYPGTYKDGQLRTLQRGVKGWRRAMARELMAISQAS